MQLKASTARNVPVLMVDSTDHITGKTGLTLTITASKDGGSFSSISPTVTELATGWYNIALTTTHTNTTGFLALHITATGADPTDVMFEVVTLLPGDSVTVGTNSDKTGYRLSATGVDDILDEVVEGSFTFRQYLRLIASTLFGKVSGAGTTTPVFRDTGDSKDRVTATTDNNGNRSAVTLDAT